MNNQSSLFVPKVPSPTGYSISTSEPPVKIYQTPENPKNTRYANQKWENLLYTAAKKLTRFGYSRWKSIRDRTGIIALEYPKFLVVAKKYLWRGYMASIHNTTLKRAAGKNKKVVMFIAEQGWFYELDPKRVLEDDETKPNIRGYDYTQKMMNFNIRLGERIFKPQTELGSF